ncbi:hypothetical protein [Dyadobacter aurulentus]|uniref:hypothetical protein n=1 Tax=Dyadobacter sp. UC 10 TaxID=2605428 RepID=UPI0011F22BFB|nr:hypothetical protein [Dyadobacter sp. UC 10]KAA0988932.1 hypothetical protein FXO21_01520 [Dyadobacter sp. UC 10]
MNSSEQKDFEHITPTDEEVNDTIRQIRARIASPDRHDIRKEQIAQGYELALEILSEKSSNYADIPMKAGSEPAKAIAVLAINYLKGECSRQVLLAYSAG